ncbi:hypothetical protein MRX96_026765 [Rhipicephalus microplus]
MASRLITGGSGCSPDIGFAHVQRGWPPPERYVRCIFSGSNQRNGARSMLIIAASRAASSACRDPRQSAPTSLRPVRRFCHSERNALPCDTYIECTRRLRDEDLLHDCSIALTQVYGIPATQTNGGGCSMHTARLGLPHVGLDHLRFPRAHRITLLRAFEALLNVFYDADLFTRL